MRVCPGEQIRQAAGVYLARQRRGHGEGSEAVQGSRRGRARRQRRVSVHLIDVREPEVLLHQWPEESAGENPEVTTKEVVKIMAKLLMVFDRLMFADYCVNVLAGTGVTNRVQLRA